jgi:hypothetical protein
VSFRKTLPAATLPAKVSATSAALLPLGAKVTAHERVVLA